MFTLCTTAAHNHAHRQNKHGESSRFKLQLLRCSQEARKHAKLHQLLLQLLFASHAGRCNHCLIPEPVHGCSLLWWSHCGHERFAKVMEVFAGGSLGMQGAYYRSFPLESANSNPVRQRIRKWCWSVWKSCDWKAAGWRCSQPVVNNQEPNQWLVALSRAKGSWILRGKPMRLSNQFWKTIQQRKPILAE